MARPGNNTGGYYGQGFRGQRVVCAVCGLWFYPDEVEKEDGVWKCTVSPRCVDEKDHEGN